MANWFVGLSTRAAAERAAKWGGIACLFQAARETLGNFATSYFANKPIDDAVVWFLGASLIPVFVGVAGIRLWRYGGWIWGSLANLVVAADLISAAVNLGPTIDGYTRLTAGAPSTAIAMKAAMFTGFAIKIAIVAFIINGVRGALALEKVDYSNDLRGVFS
jgi:hypothetical protein